VRYAVRVAAAAVAAIALVLLYREFTIRSEVPVQSALSEEILVMRTRGGWLEVSTVKSTELFDSAVDHDIFGLSLGQTVTRIRVPAHFTYRIRLAREWKVLRRDDSFLVVVPQVEPSLPVAVDLGRMQKYASGIWSPLTGPAALDQLERQITAKLARKAVSPFYIQLQRDAARRTVAEFVQKWLVTHSKWGKPDSRKIRVLFADEPIESLGPVVFPLYQPPRTG
jgi:hypothetical protein